MRIQGYFGQFDAPCVKARVICKPLGIDDAIIFLVDKRKNLVLITDEDFTI